MRLMQRRRSGTLRDERASRLNEDLEPRLGTKAWKKPWYEALDYEDVNKELGNKV